VKLEISAISKRQIFSRYGKISIMLDLSCRVGRLLSSLEKINLG
jgi:hypothetical protein